VREGLHMSRGIRRKPLAAARLATKTASGAVLRSLREIGAEIGGNAARAEFGQYAEHNIRLHQRILELSGCAMLSSTASSLFLRMHGVWRRAMGGCDRAGRSVVDHVANIEAPESRDADPASELVRAHTVRLHEHARRTWTRLETRSRARALPA
jgi:DNA-binding GntR family transcriptional regulator